MLLLLYPAHGQDPKHGLFVFSRAFSISFSHFQLQHKEDITDRKKNTEDISKMETTSPDHFMWEMDN